MNRDRKRKQAQNIFDTKKTNLITGFNDFDKYVVTSERILVNLWIILLVTSTVKHL